MFEIDPSYLPELVKQLDEKTNLQVCMDSCYGDVCKFYNIPTLFVINECEGGQLNINITNDGYIKSCCFTEEKQYIGTNFELLTSLYPLKNTNCCIKEKSIYYKKLPKKRN